MSEILRKWLSARLGIIIDYNLTSFEEICQDGTMLAQILNRYGILPSSHLTKIKKTYDADIAYSNIVTLRKYLNNIGIPCTDKTMHSIANKVNGEALRLFYQLYVVLNTKTKLNYLVDLNKEESSKDFTGSSIKSVKRYNACEINEISVSPYVYDTKQMLKWHKNKYMELMQRCEQVRKEYGKRLENKLKESEENKLKSLLEHPYLKNQIIENKKIKVTDKNIPRKPDIDIQIDEEGRCVPNKEKAKNYVNYLKHKQRRLDSSRVMQQQINKLLLNEILDRFIQKEDEEFKSLISSKLLRQSCYEKQLTVKLIDVRHQKQVMLENLQNENKQLARIKDKEYTDKFFQQEKNLSLKEQRYQYNKKRQYELHKRLWKKYCTEKHKRHYKLCNDIVIDLIDLAIKTGEYFTNFTARPSINVWKEWASLFCSGQPILDIIQDPTDLFGDTHDFDEPLTMELYRQIGLDESDFNDYNSVHGLWSLESATEFYEENKEAIDFGGNILGYIIHRLLLLKYPRPKPPEIPVLPSTDVRACLTGLQNLEILPVLQTALIKKEILVLQMQMVVNYCLEKFLVESIVEVDAPLIEETNKGVKGKQGKPPKGKVPSKGRKLDSNGFHIEKAVKETQTPKIFPGEELQYTKAAELGKYAYETLHLGLQINENLLTAMLMEYLKQITHVKGWVLINFPETINEAYFIEEVFNGKEIPANFRTNSQIVEEEEEEYFENRDEIFKELPDPYVSLRHSKLVPNPKYQEPTGYQSFFTSFIEMNYQPSGSDIENEHTSTDLIHFYDSLFIGYSYSYSVFNYDTIREIIYYITKDDNFANEIYDELFQSAIFKSNEKKKKSEDPVVIVKDKKGKHKKNGVKSDKSVNKIVGSEQRLPSTFTSLEKLETKPGDENWEYIDLPLKQDFARVLATTWQQLEQIYMNDFRELFFVKRIYQNHIIPYVHEVDTNMHKYIARPDKKQEYLHEFQTLFNKIESDLRDDDEYKAELHFRVGEFRDKLWNICDTRMKECEEERKNIIHANWFTNHCYIVTNLFVNAAQLELDRCVNSLQIIQDYYSHMLSQNLDESKFTKLYLSKFEQAASTTQIKKSSENVQEIIANILITITANTKNSPFVKFLENLHQTAISYINTWQTASLASIKLLQDRFAPKPGKEKVKSKKNVVVSLTAVEINLNKNIERIFHEWTSAVTGELLRTQFRLKLIHEKATSDLSDNLYQAEQLFHDIYIKIQDRYSEEVESVDSICQIFARAVEACEPVQTRLVLDGSKVSVDQNVLFYQDSAFTYATVKERHADFEFTIAQLNLLVNILIDLAPDGDIPARTFVFLLQDMIRLENEDGVDNPLPTRWHLLEPYQVVNLVDELYEYNDNINWKDFIIWNLILPYPTEFELLEVRRQFREMDPDILEYVNHQQFSAVHFWFEEEFSEEQEILRMNLIKELLCKMFTIYEDQINYTGLLLYFCKDVDSMRGFCKALELSLGNFVCWDTDIGVKFMNMLRYQKELEVKRQKEALSAANDAVDTIVTKTLKICVSSNSFLDIIEDEPSSLENNKFLCEESCSFIFEDEYITDEEICETAELPSMCYFLKFSVLLKVMTAAFPWHTTVPYSNDTSLRQQLEEIYISCQREEFDNKVFMHEFLNNLQFIELLDKTSKFLEHCPSEVVRNYVEVCSCPNKEE